MAGEFFTGRPGANPDRLRFAPDNFKPGGKVGQSCGAHPRFLARSIPALRHPGVLLRQERAARVNWFELLPQSGRSKNRPSQSKRVSKPHPFRHSTDCSLVEVTRTFTSPESFVAGIAGPGSNALSTALTTEPRQLALAAGVEVSRAFTTSQTQNMFALPLNRKCIIRAHP